MVLYTHRVDAPSVAAVAAATVGVTPAPSATPAAIPVTPAFGICSG